MRLTCKPVNHKGDTIVEVLIAIAIVSSVLAGAFNVTQKSSLAVRDSQERGEMLQLLKGQVELVRSMAVKATDTNHEIYDITPKYFCINPGTLAKVNFAVSVTTLAADYSNYANPCKGLGPADLYNIAVTYDDSRNVFTFIGNWDRLGGGKNSMQLSYRIPPGQPTAVLTSPTATDDDISTNLSNKNDSGGDGDDGASAPTQRCYEEFGWNDARCWKLTMYNRSDNSLGKLEKCVWDWDDEQEPETFAGNAPECQEGAKVVHEYTPRGVPTNRTSFTVTLTNYSASSGVQRAASLTILRPR